MGLWDSQCVDLVPVRSRRPRVRTDIILTRPDEIETWLVGPTAEVLKLQRPLPDDALRIVARGSKEDGPPMLQLAAKQHHRPSCPRPIAAPPPIGGRFMMTKPERSRCSTSRLATIAAIVSPAWCVRLRPL